MYHRHQKRNSFSRWTNFSDYAFHQNSGKKMKEIRKKSHRLVRLRDGAVSTSREYVETSYGIKFLSARYIVPLFLKANALSLVSSDTKRRSGKREGIFIRYYSTCWFNVPVSTNWSDESTLLAYVQRVFRGITIYFMVVGRWSCKHREIDRGDKNAPGVAICIGAVAVADGVTRRYDETRFFPLDIVSAW